ncbi:MAG: M24 family metallopeptidase [Candidatus Binatia bacterium]
MYNWPQADWDALRRYRTENVRRVMQEKGVDAVVLTGPDNIRYASDFRAWFIIEAFDWYAAVVTAEGDSFVFVPFLDEDQKDPEPTQPWIRQYVATPSWVSSASQPGVWARLLKKKLEALGVHRVGMEAVPLSIQQALRQDMSRVEFHPVEKELALARQMKHPEEIKLIEASATVASLGCSAALESIIDGRRDNEIVAVACHEMHQQGAETVTHHLCLHRQAEDWYAHGKHLWEGDTFCLDVGCYGMGGYGSDMCRTAFVGTPPKVVQDAYKALQQAYGEGQAAAKPGIKASQLDALINGVLKKLGYPGTPYSMGHGVGMRACELPIIYRREMMDEDAELKEGMVITLEPETRVEHRGDKAFVKLEDTFAVTATGLRRLTTSGYNF